MLVNASVGQLSAGTVVALLSVMAGVLLAAAAEAQPKAEEFVVPTREAFLRLLDLEKPELAPVKAALDRGDVDAAGAAYAAYFRTKPIGSPLMRNWDAVKRGPAYKTAAADRYLAGHLTDGYAVYEVPPAGLDWHESPLSCVTRFPIFSALRYAIHHTGEAKYLRWTVDHILGYMNAYPIEEFAGKRTQEGWRDHFHVAKPWYWCMIPERLTEMSETVALIRRYPEVTDEELLRILHRMLQEVGYLRGEIKPWVDRRHNGGCAMIEAMAMSCALLEDFRPAREWRDYAAQLAAQYIDQAFYPDGMCVELTTAYSASVSLSGQQMASALRDEKPIRALREKLAAMVTCMVGLSDPTGLLPSFGDLYAGKLGRYVDPALVEWLDLPWATAVARGKGDAVPPFTTWPVPGQEQWCGYYTMRSGWDPDARYLAIDGGAWGTTHQHGDRLSFALTAHGAQLVIDPSSTRYASNEPDAFISRQPSGFLHNTITVDGVDEYMNPGSERESQEPLKNRWEQGEGYTLFAGSYSFAPVKEVRWERRVLFAGGDYWLLQDVLTGPQESARVEQNFQLEAGIEVELREGRAVAKAPNGTHLVLVPLSGGLKPEVSLGDKTPHVTYWADGKPKDVLAAEDGKAQRHGRGWTGRGSNKLIPAPAVTFTGIVKLPAVITLALVPIAPGRDPAVLPAIASEPAGGKTIWRLPAGGRTIRFATDIEACAVEGKGAP